jgi:F-type H+-transporting ATPase subunit b
MVKRILFFVLALSPLALFASEGGETDILQRTVNFIIFAAILYYLLADKVKAFFADRTQSIQAELDKVQDTLKASEQKVEDAKKELEKAKKLAAEIVEGSSKDIEKIKAQVAKSVEHDIAALSRNLDEKMQIETRNAKMQIVNEVLEELLSGDNVKMTQDELANIVLKKVA